MASIRLLIVDSDAGYAEHLSGVLSRKYQDAFDVSICRSEKLRELISVYSFDAAIINPSQLPDDVDLSSIKLPLILWDDRQAVQLPEKFESYQKVYKYRRVSLLVSDIRDKLSQIPSVSNIKLSSGQTLVTAIYSPSGGSGNTTVALAYTAKQAANKRILYLSLESFVSTPVYFQNDGVSISVVLARLERPNPDLVVQSACKRDMKTGISYFCAPENYDDLNVISKKDVEFLIKVISNSDVCDELVVDLSTVCDIKCKTVLDIADKVYVVSEPSKTAQTKLSQFMSQNNVFESIRAKATLVINRGGSPQFKQDRFSAHLFLPVVQSRDCEGVYRTLSSHNFEEV